MNDSDGPNERAADRAYKLIRRDIVTGQLSGGLRLGEKGLAEEYGLSRTPIRESLRRLQSEGLVEVLPHRGARVVDWHTLDVEGIYDLRALLEGYVAGRSASRISSEELQRLAGLCDEMEELTGRLAPGEPDLVDSLAELNADFHGSIATAAGGYQVAAVRNIVVVVPLVLQMIRVYTLDDHQRSNRHHRELLRALAAGDGSWASSVMRSHVYAAKNVLMGSRDDHDKGET